MEVEGIPEGWELVKVGRVKRGEFFVDNLGCAYLWSTSDESRDENYVIIRKIQKPKRFRPFANAAEFRPHKERWILRAYKDWVDGDGEYRIAGFDDDGVWPNPNEFCSYRQMLDDDRRFDDGTPFGVEVTE